MTIIDQSNIISDYEISNKSYQHRIKVLQEQLQSADFKILELSNQLETGNCIIPEPIKSKRMLEESEKSLKVISDELINSQNFCLTLKKNYKKVCAVNYSLQNEIDELKKELEICKATHKKLEPIFKIDNIEEESLLSSNVSDASANDNGESLELMLALIKDLSTTNKKLEADLDETKNLLTSAQTDISQLRHSYNSSEIEISESEPINVPAHKSVFGELEDYVISKSLQNLKINSEPILMDYEKVCFDYRYLIF